MDLRRKDTVLTIVRGLSNNGVDLASCPEKRRRHAWCAVTGDQQHNKERPFTYSCSYWQQPMRQVCKARLELNEVSLLWDLFNGLAYYYSDFPNPQIAKATYWNVCSRSSMKVMEDAIFAPPRNRGVTRDAKAMSQLAPVQNKDNKSRR